MIENLITQKNMGDFILFHNVRSDRFDNSLAWRVYLRHQITRKAEHEEMCFVSKRKKKYICLLILDVRGLPAITDSRHK